ncbi:hypothetical protein ACR720_01170 [Sphingomonas parapaucimobilis]|uniref:hypothetical protein n=1 Tax=Sphingomonas parapaucimobilis TaxID=28213 RepID=UPI0039E8AB19
MRDPNPTLGPQTADTLANGLVPTPSFPLRFSLSTAYYEIDHINKIDTTGYDFQTH